MIRTKTRKKEPDAILTADWHLREDTPTCRTDDFWEAQWGKVDQVTSLQIEYGCPVIHAGDLLDNWRASPYLLSTCIKKIPENMWSIYGNHDLPQHSINLAEKTGIMTLVNAKRISILDECHWLATPTTATLFFPSTGRNMLVWHVMTWEDKNPIPGGSDPSAKQILKKYPECDIIVTGHNHATFVEEYEGRLLVNPGSITRQTADQENHRPCVFLWYEESNTVEQVFLKCSKGVVSRKHIEERENVDARIAAFVDKLNSEWQAGLSFEENLERFRKENKISKLVMDIIYKAMEKSNER
jgi:predicted phosphodiesterase